MQILSESGAIYGSLVIKVTIFKFYLFDPRSGNAWMSIHTAGDLYSWITQRYKRLELLYKQSSVNVLAGLQSSFKIVCDLFNKISGVGGWAFVQWCSMTWSRSVFVFLITGYVHWRARHFLSPIVELLRLEEWQGHDVCPLPHSLR